jgi:hypothetical protein
MYRAILARSLMTSAALPAFMIMGVTGVHPETVIFRGTEGATGADGVNPGDNGLTGGDGEPAAAHAGSVHPITSPQNSATATGGNGGRGGSGNASCPGCVTSGGNGGNGGAATATAATTIISGPAEADASASGGAGGGGGGDGGDVLPGVGANGGDAGSATAHATGSSRKGNVTVSASAAGGNGGEDFSQFPGGGFVGAPGDGNAMADASAGGGGTAKADAVATGGITDLTFPMGAANATSNAQTAKGAMAQAQSTGFGSSGEFQSTAKTSLAGVSVLSTAMAPADGLFMTTTNAIAQGVSGPNVNADAVSTALPDKAYATRLIDGASNVADALLGPGDKVFGTTILGALQTLDNSTALAGSTFDFRHRGDLLLGLIDGSGGFSIMADGVEILSESFVDDSVINLGNSGPNIDLTLSVANGSSGVFAVGSGVIPETSTWAMMLTGFVGLGFVSYRASRTAKQSAG